MSIKKVYVGLPKGMESKVFWVQQKYRTNNLSSSSGGTDLIVEYRNGDIFGYDNIKFPSKYIEKLFIKYSVDSHNPLKNLKNSVVRIFARKNEGTLTNHKFDEIWNYSSEDFPYKVLEKYQTDICKKYLELFKSDLKFANQYISCHFPFEYNDVINNWNNLTIGSGHYSVIVNDINWIFPSIFGLSYNKRIKWNSKLRARYEYGFDNPYMGCVDGLGKDPVEFDEKDFQDDIIPLDFEQEINNRSWLKFCTARSLEEYIESDVDYFVKSESEYSFDQISQMWKNNRVKLLINNSIWDNTLSNIIDETFCEIIIGNNLETEI